MKKLLAVLCMLTCIFGLTACENKTVLSETENKYIEGGIIKAQQTVALYESILNDKKKDIDAFLAEYNADEAGYILSNSSKISMDGLGVKGALVSFSSARDTIGAIVEYGEPVGEINGKKLIVTIPVVCKNGKANVEVILSNDIFQNVLSCTINAELTTAEMMEKAGLNTLLGMGTVFVVLILIMCIIYSFKLISKFQNSAKTKKNVSKSAKKETVIETSECINEVIDEPNDLELVAVITAAIAASEGTSSDGFVVRSIRRMKRC